MSDNSIEPCVMGWQKLMLFIGSEMATQLEIWLTEEGAVAVTLEDGTDPTEIGAERKQEGLDASLVEDTALEMAVWSELKLTGLFDSQTDIDAVMYRLQSKCKRKLTFQLQALPDQIWETVWQEHFKPIRFGEKLWVCPSWCEPPQPSAINLLLDPGMAFGTGTHATTALCLEWLAKRNLSGKTVIDFGCGSGILAIAALLLGAEKAIAVDNDPQALTATYNNGQKNNLDESRLNVYLPQQLPTIEADIVLANILARPLVELAARIISLTKPAGSVLLAGILTTQRDEVMQAYADEIEMVEVQQREDWICLHGHRQTSGKPR